MNWSNFSVVWVRAENWEIKCKQTETDFFWNNFEKSDTFNNLSEIYRNSNLAYPRNEVSFDGKYLDLYDQK